MTRDNRDPRSKTAQQKYSHAIEAIAEAAARGRPLSPVEVRSVYDALQRQGHSVRNHFHAGY